MRRVLLLAAILLGIAAVPNPLAAQPAPYEIPVILSLTGTAAFLGQTEADALRVLERQVNASGGIGGRPIRFAISDNESNPQVDVQLMNLIIAKHVPVVIDGGPLAACRAVAPLIAKDGPVYYCLSPAFYPPKGGYAFAAGASTEDGTRTDFNFLRNAGWKRLAIINTTDATGQEADRVLRAQLALPENRDLTAVAWEHFAPSDISVAAQMSKIRESNPQVLLAFGTGTPVATVYHSMQDAALDLPVLGGNGNQTYAQMTQWASFLPRQYYLYSFKWAEYRELRGGPVKDAMRVLYRSFDAAGLRPDLGASLAWDPALIVVSVLRKLGPQATAQQVRDAILGITEFAGIDGFYDFRVGNQRGLTLKDCIVVRWDASQRRWIPASGSGGAKR
jgi:branched-chain amino acid transport system substrate-binding protein